MDAAFKVAALVFFFLFFCGIIAWTFWSRRSRGFSRDAALPLDDGRPADSEAPTRNR